MPLLGGVSEGTHLEAHMGIIRDSQENLLHCLSLFAREAAYSSSYPRLCTVSQFLLASPCSGKALCFKAHDNRKRKEKTTSLASFQDLVRYRVHSQFQEEESVCVLYTR